MFLSFVVLEGDAHAHTNMHQHTRSRTTDRDDHKNMQRKWESLQLTPLYSFTDREHDGLKRCSTMNDCLNIHQMKTEPLWVSNHISADEESNIISCSRPTHSKLQQLFFEVRGKNYVGNSTAKDDVIIQNRSLSCGLYSEVHFMDPWGSFRLGEGCVGFEWQH